MSRRRHRSDEILRRHGNKIAIGFFLILLAGFVLITRFDHSHNPLSQMGPGWDCNRPGGLEGDICFKKNSANSN